jgi:hypothetical protein
MTDGIELLLAMSVILCTMVAVLTYYSKAAFLFKLITMPFAIAASASAIWTIIYLAGAPINRMPANTWVYVGHQLIDKGETIVMWIWSDDLGDFRLHKFPYDRETQKKLEEARQQSEGGNMQEGRFDEDDKTGEAVLQMRGYQPVTTENNVKQ